MCTSSRLARIACAFVCATLGCGRVGFESTQDDVTGLDGSVATNDAGAMDASATDAQVDADPTVSREGGTPPGDGPDRGDAGPADAALPTRDAMIDAPDAGEAPSDAAVAADASQPDVFDCARFGTTLACADFSTTPADFELREVDGDLTVSQGTLKASTTRAGGIASIRRSFEPVFSGTLYARFLLRVPSDASIVAINLLALAEPTGGAVDEIDTNLLAGDSFDLFVLGSSARYTSGARAFARDRFQCVEVTLDLANTGGRMRIDVNGERVLTSGLTDTSLARGIARVALGIDFTGAQQGPTKLEIDEFVLARAKVADCP